LNQGVADEIKMGTDFRKYTRLGDKEGSLDLKGHL
jgi:hypothetical protein